MVSPRFLPHCRVLSVKRAVSFVSMTRRWSFEGSPTICAEERSKGTTAPLVTNKCKVGKRRLIVFREDTQADHPSRLPGVVRSCAGEHARAGPTSRQHVESGTSSGNFFSAGIWGPALVRDAECEHNRTHQTVIKFLCTVRPVPPQPTPDTVDPQRSCRALRVLRLPPLRHPVFPLFYEPILAQPCEAKKPATDNDVTFPKKFKNSKIVKMLVGNIFFLKKME